MSDARDQSAGESSTPQPSIPPPAAPEPPATAAPPSTMVGEVPPTTTPVPPIPRPPDPQASPATIVGTVPGMFPPMPYGQPTLPGGYDARAPHAPPAGPIPEHMPPADDRAEQAPGQWSGYTMPPPRGEKWKQAAGTAASMARLHLLRAVSRDLRDIEITPEEAPRLIAHNVHDRAIQQYLLWRRSWLFVLLPIALVAAVIQIIGLFRDGLDLSSMSWFGVFVLGTMVILQMVGYPIAAALAVWKWDQLRFSRWVLVGGFFASYLLPFIVALIPFGNFIVIQETDPQVVAQQKVFSGIVGAVIWLVTLLPALLAILPGILRASVRIKSLLPESIVPGWLIVMTAPFFSLLLLVAFAIVNQVAGNLLLIIGMLLIMAAPAVFLVRTDLLIKPVTQPVERRRLEMMQAGYVVTIGIGMALLMLYFVTVDILGRPLVGNTADAAAPAMIGVGEFSWQVTSFVITYLAKSFFVTAVAIDLFMLLNLSVWKNLKAFEGTGHAAEYDRIMGSFQVLTESRDGSAGPFASPPTRAFEPLPMRPQDRSGASAR